MFLPTTLRECADLGWRQLDVILVSGDSYIDTPFSGTAVIGKVLVSAGYRVGVIAQPDIQSAEDITRLGEPVLFWGVTAGVVDSMVANYTATRKKRRSDDNTPGGINNRRPDRATITYTNLIRRFYKNTRPIVLGGIEASLRRVAHYDFWSDRVRGSILLDAKADLLFYGMAEIGIVELANRLRDGQDIHDIRGLCYLDRQPRSGYLELPAYETVASDKNAFIEMFHTFYRNNDPLTARGLIQRHGDRYLVQNPPALTPTQDELDSVYRMDFERAQHPYYERQGKVKSLETIHFSIQTHRGCYGECNFCAIAVHEGRTVSWRSPDSIVDEAERLAAMPDFRGIIQDAGGPTANMYGFECAKKLKSGVCIKKRCLYPEICNQMKVDHSQQIELLRRLRQVKGVRKVFVASGIRYDMVLADQAHGHNYLRAVVRNHVSGQMKVAPEHTENNVLRHMGKPGDDNLLRFKGMFEQMTAEAGKPQFLTYYLIAAHPGCSEEDMRRLRLFTSQKLNIHPEQVQVFTPTPSTYSSLMYYTEMDPFTGEKLFVEKESGRKERQKRIVVDKEAPVRRGLHGR
ncbi:MAG TPA: YgiQ family radical SAM protein [Anaerolineaceae bacterium]|nr:MAG: YgiQ family radical SAM protein [Chloroflexi bacterium GWB2_54_36]HAL17460.1 YgiQ family radical SAM protein [Anaerolineaceae bacterium]